MDKWYGALRSIVAAGVNPARLPDAFEAALADDLNTPQAIAHIHELANSLNRTPTAALKAQLLACSNT